MAIRLVRTDTLRLTSFMGLGIPKYAILSHAWDHDGEISFQEMMAISEDPDHLAGKKSGYAKIAKACQEAKRNGIDYVWVDTCCIDKTSSSELSESINSMYKWYQKAEVCFALLADFNADSAAYETALPKCRWFTRGWCLQELIAPQDVEFFDVNWNHIGSKAGLTSLISKITRIDEGVLIDNSLITSTPVACRMSWAAERNTTREEDMAYCLLGIFDVNMPMLYGEGPKAFIRLQKEIIKTSNDLSIFAFLHGSTSHGSSSQPYCDLFATSPRDFMSCGNLVNIGTVVHWNDAFALTNKGLYFRRAKLQTDILHGSYSMLLNCMPSEFKFSRMYLRKVGPSLFARYDDYRSASTVNEIDPKGSEAYYTEIEEAYIIAKVTPSVQLQLERADEYAIHVRPRDHHLSRALQVIKRSPSSDRWDAARMKFLTKGERLLGSYWKLFPNLMRPDVEAEKDHQAPLGHCYLVCGVEHPEYSSYPRAWVRLYSLEEWRHLETELGIITQLDNTTSRLNIGYTSDRITLGKSSTRPMIVTATVKLATGERIPRFELELDINEEPQHGYDSRE